MGGELAGVPSDSWLRDVDIVETTLVDAHRCRLRPRAGCRVCSLPSVRCAEQHHFTALACAALWSLLSATGGSGSLRWRFVLCGESDGAQRRRCFECAAVGRFGAFFPTVRVVCVVGLWAGCGVKSYVTLRVGTNLPPRCDTLTR